MKGVSCYRRSAAKSKIWIWVHRSIRMRAWIKMHLDRKGSVSSRIYVICPKERSERNDDHALARLAVILRANLLCRRDGDEQRRPGIAARGDDGDLDGARQDLGGGPAR